ncbi:MAG: toxin-activating lysine-acyltransferase [Rhizobiaceae bacterium]
MTNVSGLRDIGHNLCLDMACKCAFRTLEMETKDQPSFRLAQPKSPAVALGMAVSYLMTKPAFASLKFGDWSRILVGQINRKHFIFVVDEEGKTCGFAGWGLTSEQKAEAWADGTRALQYEDCVSGECIVFNAWAADSTAIHRFMVDETRKFGRGLKFAYFKRHYSDGRTRPARMVVNKYVGNHISRKD